jgi:hypothetical protein
MYLVRVAARPAPIVFYQVFYYDILKLERIYPQHYLDAIYISDQYSENHDGKVL